MGSESMVVNMTGVTHEWVMPTWVAECKMSPKFISSSASWMLFVQSCSGRVQHRFMWYGINSWDRLEQSGEWDLLNIPGFGSTCMREVRRRLNDFRRPPLTKEHKWIGGFPSWMPKKGQIT